MRLEKEYLHSYWISDANIWMEGGQEMVISSPVKDFYLLFIIYYLPGYKLL